MRELLEYFRSTLGKKVIMAVTGVVLFLFVVVHLLGNLQIYLGPEQLNRYAELLRRNMALLWFARVFLLTTVVVHILVSIQVWLRNRASRPVGYRVFRPPAVDYASRTMIWSGPVVGVFVLYHILHLSTGTMHAHFTPGDVYTNVVVGFRSVWVSAVYIIANLLLGMHLYHGMWSLFQTMGWEHPLFDPLRRRFAAVAAVLVAAGNVSFPLAVLTGVVGLG